MVVLVLVATGLPIQFPDLRAGLVGGYGRTIASIHEWSGVVMLAVPILALAWAPSWATTSLRLRARRRANLGLHAINLWFTLLSGVMLVVTGFIMWMPGTLPLPLIDTSAQLHAAASWGLYVMLPVHLLVTRQRVWAATREWTMAAARLARAAGGTAEQTEDQACW
ncbi:MAG: cytochrome b/b6 domain-containing protein [Proteobacteria bacterium]|nr:cytochrome b/b6 domain-containing protein [Pseudomonadota bacterium]